MSLYTVSNLIEDAGRRYARCMRQGAPAELPLREVWDAVDRYLLSCLEKHRGLILPNFCRIGWQGARKNGRANSQLYFELVDSFCRTYNVSNCRFQSAALEVDLCVMEDFNFTKAAICFSQKLAKDHVTSSMRVLVNQIGEALSQGRLLSLEFSIGKLLGKEREARFVFAADMQQQLLSGTGTMLEPASPRQPVPRAARPIPQDQPDEDPAEGLEVNCVGLQPMSMTLKRRPGGFRHKRGQGSMTSRRKQPAEKSDILLLDVLGSTVGAAPASARRSARVQTPFVHADCDAFGQPLDSRAEEDVHCVQDPVSPPDQRMETRTPPLLHSSQRPDAGGPLSRPSWTPSLSQSQRPAATPRSPVQGSQQDRDDGRSVIQQCMDESVHRHITGLEKRASEAMRQRAEETLKLSERETPKECEEKKKRAARMQEHSAFLKKQIEVKENRRKAEIELDRMSTKESVSYTPRQAGMSEHMRDLLTSQDKEECKSKLAEVMTQDSQLSGLPRPSSLLGRAKANSELKEQLDEQVEARRSRREAQLKLERSIEVEMLEADSKDMQNRKELEQAAKQYGKDALHAAWREQSRIRSVHKSIEALERGKRVPSLKEVSLELPDVAGLEHRPLSAALTPRVPGNLASAVSGIVPLSARPTTGGIELLGTSLRPATALGSSSAGCETQSVGF